MTIPDYLKEKCLAFSDKKFKGNYWEDVTIYSQSNKERIPTVFRAKFGFCIITIVYGHIDYKESWVFHCRELGFNTSPLPTALTPADAANEAIAICKKKAKDIYESLL